MKQNDKIQGDKMSTPKYPHIKVSMNHNATDPLAVLFKVSFTMKREGVPTSELDTYVDTIMRLVDGDLNNAERAVAVARESMKWVTLSD